MSKATEYSARHGYLNFPEGRVNVQTDFGKPITLIPTEELASIERKARIDELYSISAMIEDKDPEWTLEYQVKTTEEQLKSRIKQLEEDSK